MSNEEGNSSHSVNNQVDPATHHLLDCVRTLNVSVEFSPIYVVPDILREVNSSSFTPRVVSIGPLHKGRRNLKSVESKKPKYMSELLQKVGEDSMQETLDNCVKKVREKIQIIRTYYFGKKVEDYTDDELVEMMVMDGCYILQFIDNLYNSKSRLRSRNIALDLMLLENQIPFFVLKDIYDLTIEKLSERHSLTYMLKILLDHINPFVKPLKVKNLVPDETTTTTTTSSNAPFHILGLLHKFYRPNFTLPKITKVPTEHSAVELGKFGMKIRPNKNLAWPMAIEFEKSMFWRTPSLRMPVVRIDNFFEVVFRNLIAYEQYSPVDNYVTSYACAMCMVASTPENIGILRKSHVIVISQLDSKEKASDMISSICKNVNVQDFYYMKQWENIELYYYSYLARNYKVLKQTYLNTPWKAIALLAAILVFVMTVTQFINQVASFH